MSDTWNGADLREGGPLPEQMSELEAHRWYAGQIINGFASECRKGQNLSDRDLRDMAARAHALAKLMVDMEPPQ